MTSDLDLLRQFARENSQDAFAKIVRRHVDLVYSAALRQIRSPQLAEEISQSVFSDLARNAGKLSKATGCLPVLTAWLYAVTRRTAIDVIRKESRRQLREQIAVEMQNMNATANDWIQIEPLLDDAMAALDETDRVAILLRYFENKNLREVGEQLNISDDAAQKRVSRAVEKLREFFSKRSVTIAASGLAVLISANAVQAAPVGLAATIAEKTLVTTTATLTKAILMTTLQKTVVIAAVFSLAGTGIYEVVRLTQKHTATSVITATSNSTGDYVPRDQFAFAGYATPESTIKSLLWIQSKGDFDAMLASATPRFRGIIEQAVKSAPKGESTIINAVVAESKNYLGYRITGLEKISDDKIVVSVLVDDARLKQIGHGDIGYYALIAKSQKQWQLVRINSEWKYDGPPTKPK